MQLDEFQKMMWEAGSVPLAASTALYERCEEIVSEMETIEEEKLKGQLIDVKNEHQRKEALIDGEAEAERDAAFIKGLKDVTSGEEAIAIFNEIRKQEIMTALAQSDAHLYFTPAECDLRLGHTTKSYSKERK